MTISIAAPPPPSLTRPMLQASFHARGKRPFSFAGNIDEWHAPGVVVRNGITQCAVDSAWLVAHVLGAPKSSPNAWPGVPMARERAFQYGAAWRTPDGKQARQYQMEGAAFLAERDYGFLTDAPGLGKTCQALIAAEARLSLGVVPTADTPVVLILAPALAKRHWQREVRKWTPYDAAVLDSLRPSEIPRARYIICNYDILFGARRADALGVVFDVNALPGWGPTLANQFLVVIADEAHVLRGRGSRKTQAVDTVAKRATAMWGLTGTLMPNRVRDLWSPVNVVSGGLWGRYYPWAQKYCDAQQGQYGWVDKGASNLEELAKRLYMFVMGRTADSVHLELPPMQRERFPIDVEVSAPTVHDGHRAMDKEGAVRNAFRKTAFAKRAAVVQQATESIEAGQKVVVFLYMRDQCDAVAKAVKSKTDHPVFAVHGDMSPEGRDKMAQTFRETTGPAAFVATIDSVGMAISLVGADLVLFGDLLPEPWKMYQAELRCYRFDSTKSVLIRYLLATGTIDERYAETVIAKIEDIQTAMGQGGDQGALSTMLGGRTSTEIVDSLFEKLKSWSSGGEG